MTGCPPMRFMPLMSFASPLPVVIPVLLSVVSAAVASVSVASVASVAPVASVMFADPESEGGCAVSGAAGPSACPPRARFAPICCADRLCPLTHCSASAGETKW